MCNAEHVLHTVYPGPTASSQIEADKQYEEMTFDILSIFNSMAYISMTSSH